MDRKDVDHAVARMESELVAGDPGFERCVRKLERRLRRVDRRAAKRRRPRFRWFPSGAEALLWSLALMSGSSVAVSAWYEACRTDELTV